tara:strand:- start:2272 stop:2865 length:594 start_codon:yes stop_codon:yes gene_type:complete
MKKLLLLVGILAMPSFAAVSANVAFASDYVWRGMTQSDAPAIQGGFDFEAESGFYAGIWGSNVNFSDGAGSELDYYFGYGFSVGDLGIDIGYVAFDYPKNTLGLDFEEIVLGFSLGNFGLTHAMGQDDFTDYTEISYGMGPVSVAYGTYDEMSDNITISYGFSCGAYDCGITAYDMTDEGYSGVDEDGIYFSISASL